MSKPYCGYSTKLPKGSHFGTLEECYKKRQLRRYGLMAVNQDELLKIIENSAKKLPKNAIVSAIKEVRSILPPTTQPKTPPAKRGKNLILNLMDYPSLDLQVWKFYNKKVYKDLLQKVIDKLDGKAGLSKADATALKAAKVRISKNLPLYTTAEAKKMLEAHKGK